MIGHLMLGHLMTGHPMAEHFTMGHLEKGHSTMEPPIGKVTLAWKQARHPLAMLHHELVFRRR